MKELAAKYDHKAVEEGKYQTWVSKNYFTAGDLSKRPYCIVIPPPNVTGKLHLGHAWDTTLQDIISRYKRMNGYDMLWLSGMDHAGIATQAKVDAKLKDMGISRYDIGREKFLEHAWAWKEEYAATIRQQWAKLGLSLDYSRERFTLDEGLNKAVRKVFVDLYNDGLLYQGERIINWDPEAKTALSNIEVIYKPTKGCMYHFYYDVVETGQRIEVATTRPETMFGDVCVVVHPDDERYKDIVGLHVVNPANKEVLPIITDDYIDMEFGTGAMKCTPAHDPNDFIIGEKYGFDKIVCINEDATMNEKAGEYEGLDRYECRERLVERIKAEGNLAYIEEIEHNVGYSERTDVIVEPYLSKQWFVKMKPLAEEVLKYQGTEEGITFYPPRFNKTFTQWLENIEDWCVSRQLWWGHRIPAWYHNETGEVYVGMEAPSDAENWHQDEDVLDTWFSSALWPFSTLGWPEDTADFERYYPTDCLVTGYDIIFFWVARMAFQARYFTHAHPFKDCLIHGLIRDAQGRKMSKSLGNGVDPMDVIEEYGVDALRFFLTNNSTPGQDIRYIPEKVEAAGNFINKIWNASRFTLMNLPDGFSLEDIDLSNAGIIDKWILARFNETLESVNRNMEKYEFALVGTELYNFIWDDFCSWYIELAKAGLYSEDADIKLATQSTLVTVLMGIVKMLHPFMPFVTEEIYNALPHKAEALCIDQWPQKVDIDADKAKEDCERLISIISAVREIKTEANLKPQFELDVLIKDESGNIEDADPVLAPILYRMTRAIWKSELEGELFVKPIRGGILNVLQEAVSNKEEEIQKLNAEKERLTKEIARSNGMLNNQNFVAKAPRQKVEEETKKRDEYQRQFDLVLARLAELNK